MTDNSLQKYKNQFDHKSYDSLPENVRKSERYFEQKLQNKKPKIVKITPKSSLRARKRTIRVYGKTKEVFQNKTHHFITFYSTCLTICNIFSLRTLNDLNICRLLNLILF